MKSTASNKNHKNQHFNQIFERSSSLLAHAWHNWYKGPRQSATIGNIRREAFNLAMAG
jgi:hypothetical protein